ncbi:hypothetical protein LK09_14700 [Microbacterium mangrovi]|uniref:NERD domain-containing protein n=1 Tax=Microbacterium mangrovi TaxID=1348253 RepID=A0A0B2A457_9MICO|nr:hypothetical protein [Microbacterium mangrovi]KHK96584.1 hypothetical protein LK09_14700 [Microbacterium mangrovi]
MDAATRHTPRLGIDRDARVKDGGMSLLRFVTRPAAWFFGARQAYLLWQLRRVIRGADAFDVIGNMFLAVAPIASEPGDGSDGTRLLAMPELVALLFAERVTGDANKAPSARVLGKVHRLAPKVLHAATLRVLFEQLVRRREPVEGGQVAPRLTAAAITREIYIRLPRFHQKERQLLGELFTPQVTKSVVDRLGFGPEAMFAVFDAFNSYIPQRLADEFQTASEELHQAVDASPELVELLAAHRSGRDAAMSKLITARAFGVMSTLVSLSLDDLLEASDVDAAQLNALLERLSIDLDADNAGAARAFLNGDNRMRTRPFITRLTATGTREWMLVQPTWLIFGMRELFEAALTEAPMDQHYMKHRGQHLEHRGMHAIVEALRPDVALANVVYRGPTGQRIEADGLVVIGQVAIVVEAKSNRLTPYARAGAPVRLWKELGPIISKAAEQAERLRALIAKDPSIHIVSAVDVRTSPSGTRKNWDLDVSEVDEVFTIALSLEDLNYLVTVTSELVESGLIPKDSPSPWVVNIHDLEVTTRLLNRPAEFIHFLSRRRRASTMNNIQAADELDYVMHYLTEGLFPEGSPDATTLILNLTNDLDAWVFYTEGLRETPAPKPAQEIDPESDEILATLEEARPFGWLGASTSLLELEPGTRARIAHEARRLRDLTAADGELHSMYLETSPAPMRPLIFIAMSFPRSTLRDVVEGRLLGYATLRKYVSKADTVHCFGAFEESDAVFDMFLTLSSPWESNDVLEAAATAARLAPGLQS